MWSLWDVKTDDHSLSLSLSSTVQNCDHLASWDYVQTTLSILKRDSMVSSSFFKRKEKKEFSHHWWCMCNCSNKYRSMVLFHNALYIGLVFLSNLNEKYQWIECGLTWAWYKSPHNNKVIRDDNIFESFKFVKVLQSLQLCWLS